MKKILSVLLAVMLLTALCVPAFATGGVEGLVRYTPLGDGLRHANQVSLDGGKTWMTTSKDLHTYNTSGVCMKCGYSLIASPTPTPSPEPTEEPAPSPTAKPQATDKPQVTAAPGQEQPAEDVSEEDTTAAVEGNTGTCGGHYYIVVNESVSWDIAADAAEEAGGYLACVTSKSEQDFISDLNADRDILWMGGYYVESGWIWIDAEDWSYECWADNYPTNDGVDNCLASAGTNWINLNIDDDSSVDGFIIEFDSKDDVGEVVINYSARDNRVEQQTNEEPAETEEPAEDVFAEEEEEGGISSATVIIVFAVAVVGGGIVYMLVKNGKSGDGDDGDDEEKDEDEDEYEDEDK